jgi:hypothetical protein
LNTTCDEMDGVSTGLMMRVAVCGWEGVRGGVHESAGRGRARRVRERSASARRAAIGGRCEAGRALESAAEGGRE